MTTTTNGAAEPTEDDHLAFAAAVISKRNTGAIAAHHLIAGPEAVLNGLALANAEAQAHALIGIGEQLRDIAEHLRPTPEVVGNMGDRSETDDRDLNTAELALYQRGWRDGHSSGTVRERAILDKVRALCHHRCDTFPEATTRNITVTVAEVLDILNGTDH